ncbi:hypothetical protein F4809DRAFT_266258 [Biscogniauxia mediterranea]|nr:hypothetical protein F4809DRAFT_266258 [Biscogniauxia mediterranea]
MHLNQRPLLSAALLASLSTAHVILESPKPYKFVAYGPSNPIEPSGSDFPCKIPPGGQYQIDGSPTVMAIGEDQTLSFIGKAVHGGGSCQLSLTEENPTKDSKWQVIHSIEGGCPARNQKGNLDGPNKDIYTFQIPEGIAPGSYTFAWTWQARIGGQPEFYMNCAPITVTPAKKNKRANIAERRTSVAKRADFPDLFMANMGAVSGGCTTEDALTQQVPIAYPNPGPSVERPEGDNLFQQSCDGNPRAKPGAGAGTTDGTSSTASGDTPSTTEAATPATSTTAPVETVPSAPSETSASSPTFSSAPAASSDLTPAPTSGSDGQSCVEGHLTCLEDATHFATCTGGQLTGPQPIAPGFKCRPGSGVGLDISPA